MTDQTPAGISGEPTIVPNTDAKPADDKNVVGTSLQPNPGEQPGEVAEKPVVAQSAADPHPEVSINRAREEMKHHTKPQTADDPDPEATAAGNTDPAMHNPRAPVDGSGVGNTGQPVVPTRVNAREGVAAGPVHPHSHEALRNSRPIRRGDVA